MRPLKTTTPFSNRSLSAKLRGKPRNARNMLPPNYRPIPPVVRDASKMKPSANQVLTELQVTVGNIQEVKGRILLAIYDSEANYNLTAAYGETAPAKEREVVFRFSDLPLGEYAVMAFHDIDNNSKLSVDWAGLPIEPWGASLQGRSILGAPEWSDVVFNLPAEGMALTINLHRSERIFDTLVG
ncbi:MAG: DUF2141 domain-containing protein [Granulosicoccus sp.]